MKKITYVNELPKSELKELEKQLVGHDFYYADFKEFSEQRITMVEETLLTTTFYIMRDEDNKPVTIVNNRTIKETEYMVVERNDGRIEFYNDVLSFNTYTNKQGIKELAIRVWWGGEQTATEYIELSKVKDFYYINNPDYIKQ